MSTGRCSECSEELICPKCQSVEAIGAKLEEEVKEPVYLIQYRESGMSFEDAETNGVTVTVRANNALVAVERATEKLNGMPKERKWFVHAVGPSQRQPGAQTAFI